MEILKKFRKRLENALSHVTNKDWMKCVSHAEPLQEQFFVKGLCDGNMKLVVINLQECDSDSDRNGPDVSDDKKGD